MIMTILYPSTHLFPSFFVLVDMYDPPQRTPQMAEARCFAPRNDPSKPTGHGVGAVRPPAHRPFRDQYIPYIREVPLKSPLKKCLF